MQQAKWLVAMMLVILVFTATGCGQKDATDIVGDLDKKLNNLESYKTSGTMIIQTGNQPQEYSIEVWYKQPEYYRIALTNTTTNVMQIVLRNDDGVFVLDPALNKSYRFKSDWPKSNGAVYLYQSIATSIIDDPDRVFTMEEQYYLFAVNANYQNKSLSKQKIWLDKDLRPVKVLVYDPKETQLVEMNYTQFEFAVSFDNDAFDMKRNLTGWDLDALPTMINQDDTKSFGIIEPAYIPDGITKNTPKIVTNQDERTVVIKYTGDYYYNLTESRAKAVMTSVPETSITDIVDLGFSIGILSEMDEIRKLTWTYDNIDFTLTGDLPTNEMIDVAKSVFGQAGK